MSGDKWVLLGIFAFIVVCNVMDDGPGAILEWLGLIIVPAWFVMMGYLIISTLSPSHLG